MSRFLLKNIGDLTTLAPLAKRGAPVGVGDGDLGRFAAAWLAVEAGKVAAFGQGRPPADWTTAETRQVDAEGALVLPGLVDAHTHPIFAGTRAGEFSRRLAGATYQEIAAAGGGIQATMRATREASEAQLLGLLRARLDRQLGLGVTTVEVKSGYGLSVADELRLLRVLGQAKADRAQHLSITCLALHARSPEHPDLRHYAERCTAELLPEVAAAGLADWVDAFIDDGYFTVADVAPYARRARELGLGLRLHADEFSDAGAAAAAADWGAASADHLQFANADGVRRMAAAGVTAVVLPGTSLYTKIPFAPARRFADAGLAVALATDFNPGSCLIDNLAMLATVGAVQAGLRPAETVAAVTYTAAYSLRLQARKGALAVGHDADFVMYALPSLEDWLADFGRTRPSGVYVGGERMPSAG